MRFIITGPPPVSWASYQIRKIAVCACAGNAGNVFPATGELAIPACTTAREARAVMHVEIANPRWQGKRYRHSRCMGNPQFCVSGKRPMTELFHMLSCLFLWNKKFTILTILSVISTLTLSASDGLLYLSAESHQCIGSMSRYLSWHIWSIKHI